MRRAARQDANHAAIVEVLRSMGATVCDLSPMGQAQPGCPDLLVGFRHQTYLFEVKDGSKPASKKRLTVEQREWHDAWRGAPVVIVESVNAAIVALRGNK